MKSRHIKPEELGRKITHPPPCLQTIHSRHYGLSPVSLVFGRELRLPYLLIFGTPPDKERPTLGHAADLLDHLRDIQHLNMTSDRMETCYNRLPKQAVYYRSNKVWFYGPTCKKEVTQASILMGGPAQYSHPDKCCGIHYTAEP
jgi:hypothetical protein